MDVTLYDTTLRDGTQREGLSLSAEDKVKIARRLDALGVSYIEGGWPGSNPKDAEFFRRMERVPLRQAKLAAFGMTRRAGSRCADDANCRALVDAGTPVVTLVGKSSTLHVDRVLRTSRDENLRMIAETVAHFKRLGKEVIYDAEHFARGAPTALPRARRRAPRGLPSSDRGRAPRHRTEAARRDRVGARRRALEHGRVLGEHHRGQLAGPARCARAGLVAPGLIVVGHAHGNRDLVLLAVERRQRRPIVAYFGPHDGIRPRADVQRRRATA